VLSSVRTDVRIRRERKTVCDQALFFVRMDGRMAGESAIFRPYQGRIIHEAGEAEASGPGPW